jgi:hypothetical protein
MQDRIIQPVDVLDLVTEISRTSKKFQAITLKIIEEQYDVNDPKYAIVRKAILDGFNNHARSIVKIIFGTDFEK